MSVRDGHLEVYHALGREDFAQLDRRFFLRSLPVPSNCAAFGPSRRF